MEREALWPASNLQSLISSLQFPIFSHSPERSTPIPSIRIANAPVSWGVIENISGERAGFAQVLDEIRDTGYAGTELGDWGFLPTDPRQLRHELKSRDLTLMASWVDAVFETPEAVEATEAQALQTADLLAEVAGENCLIILGNSHSRVPVRAQNAGRIRPEHALDDSGWSRFAGAVDQIAASVLEATGLRTAFHHHCATWVETPEETERLLALTDPETVGLCFDTGHYRYGGGDPVEGCRRYLDRILHVHFKDCDPAVAARARAEGLDYNAAVGQGLFCELGKGDVDFSGVLHVLEEGGYSGWIVVEQDVLPGMGSPRDSAARNRAYLQSIGLAGGELAWGGATGA